MSKLKSISIKEDTTPNLVVLRAEAVKTLAVANLRKNQNQLENTSLISSLKKVIARINTELRSREIGEGLIKGTLTEAAPSVSEEDAVSARKSRFKLGPLKGGFINAFTGEKILENGGKA